jgi:Ras-related protein Rab-23
MTQRFAKDLFTGQYKKTLGVDFLLKQKYIKSIDKDVEFMIWDTAGQEAYDAITSRYYKGASAALIVFSVTDRDSFVAVKKWYNKIRQECDSIPINLIMNKVDLVEKGVVAEKEAIELANEMKVPMYKVSVKENSMVNETFESLAVEYFKKGILYFYRRIKCK